jgi:small subunit ribosomal protein S1
MENFESEFEKFLNEEEDLQYYSKGSTVTGTIVRIDNDYAYVDIGQKTEVAIPKEEVIDKKEGEKITAIYLGRRNKDGYTLISRKPLLAKEALSKVQEAFEKNEKIQGTIAKKLEKGYIVDLGGIKAFLPLSESRINRNEKLEEGIPVEVYVLKIEERRKVPNIIVSRKKVLEEEREKEIQNLLSLLEEGKVVRTKVAKILDGGMILSIDNLLFGYLPESLLSWNKSKSVKDFKEGDELEVVIKDIDKENRKILFSLRDLEENPWENFDKQVGDIVEGTVKEINNYGIVISLGNIDGFIHKSQTSHINPNAYKSKFKVGQKVKAKIIEFDKDRRKLKLSIKETEPHPVEEFLSKNPEGSEIEAKIKDIKTKVAFIDLGEIEGILRLEDATWNPRVKNIDEVLKGKKVLKFKVLGREGDKIVLGLKQFQEDPWKLFTSQHKIGDVVKGTVKKLIERGAFIDLGNEIEGFIPVSEISKERIEIPSDKLSLKEEIEAKIMKLEPKNRKVILSIKALELDKERKEIEELKNKVKPKGEGLGTLGEILKEKLKNKGES